MINKLECFHHKSTVHDNEKWLMTKLHRLHVSWSPSQGSSERLGEWATHFVREKFESRNLNFWKILCALNSTWSDWCMCSAWVATAFRSSSISRYLRTGFLEGVLFWDIFSHTAEGFRVSTQECLRVHLWERHQTRGENHQWTLGGKY